MIVLSSPSFIISLDAVVRTTCTVVEERVLANINADHDHQPNKSPLPFAQLLSRSSGENRARAVLSNIADLHLGHLSLALRPWRQGVGGWLLRFPNIRDEELRGKIYLNCKIVKAWTEL